MQALIDATLVDYYDQAEADAAIAAAIDAAAAPIQEIVVGSGGLASADFQNIPQTTYRHLRLEGVAAPEAASITEMQIRMNNDATGNHWEEVLLGLGATASATPQSSQTSGRIFRMGATATGQFTHFTIDLPYYRVAGIPRVALCDWGTHISPNNARGANMVLYNLSTAISRITLFPASGDIKEGSVFSLYGVR